MLRVPKILAGLAAGAVLLATPMAAEAARMRATYEGVVLYGRDTAGLFGPDPDPSFMAGKRYRQTFVYETLYGLRDQGPDYDFLDSNTTYGDFPDYITIGPSPILSVTLDVDGYSETFDVRSGRGGAYLDALFRETYLFAEIRRNDGITRSAFTAFSSAPGDPVPDLETPFQIPVGGSNAQFNYTVSDIASGQELRFFSLDLNAETLTISAVPEPSTWMTLIAGFGAAGGALRRARRDYPKVLRTRT